jgi:hypothetical protein
VHKGGKVMTEKMHNETGSLEEQKLENVHFVCWQGRKITMP